MLSCTDFLMVCGIASLFAVTIHLFYFPYSYHELLVAKYGARGRNLKKLNRDLLRSGNPCVRWRGHWMWIYF